jgi:hypothetical protein
MLLRQVLFDCIVRCVALSVITIAPSTGQLAFQTHQFKDTDNGNTFTL